MSEWDYIVIGAGSAGSVLANRLSADPANRVLLLEAGGVDWSPYIHVPAAIIRAIGNPSLDWCYLAEADASRKNKVDLWPAGRALGGSSSINGMMFVRGQPSDFNRWAAAGCDGWSYEHVLPYFQRAESTALGGDDYRGREGPLRVNRLRSTHPLAEIFVKAAVERGVPFNEDYNGAEQTGVGYSQVTQSRGWRYSASRAYLWPAWRRKNLTIKTGASCERLLIDGKRITGVEYRKGGQLQQAMARQSVVLSAGVIGSPKLLMLSGIGPAAELDKHGIAVQLDVPEVGANLADHPEGMVGIEVNVSTYNTEINSWKIPLHGLNWLVFGRGPATSPYPHAVAFLKSDEALSDPDIQVQLGPYAFSFSEEGVVPYERPAISASVNISYPRNRGRVRLSSPAASAPPVIEHQLLDDEQDMQMLIAACKRVREIFRAPAFDTYRVAERQPGEAVQTDAEWAEYLRETAFLGYHGVSTCRMGADAGSVVDPELKLRGMDGLRIVDASVMPDLISGNTHATVVMIAERAADLILGRESPINEPSGDQHNEEHHH
ncbi:MAG: GMC family oxidoreductase N-terminal domain-containing protein [Gammaproteobacteria bacterium]|jgi:choline dehydrogenase|nr:GMC family oxidoreductase N-terminal domain-containing protein [Gammaproteobacteria bacterium]